MPAKTYYVKNHTLGTYYAGLHESKFVRGQERWTTYFEEKQLMHGYLAHALVADLQKRSPKSEFRATEFD